MFFERGVTLPGRSEESLAATRPCRLQLRVRLRKTLRFAAVLHGEYRPIAVYVP